MKNTPPLLLTGLFLGSLCCYGWAQNSADDVKIEKAEKKLIKLENPITAAYLKEHLSKGTPRLILTPEIEVALKAKLKTDPLVQAYYAYLKAEVEDILKQPLAEYGHLGFRMPICGVMAKRLSILAMVYRLDQTPELLSRLNDELLAVSHFSDWNPEHFLDVSQMSLGVALALDWAGDVLPPETVKLAKAALIEKAIQPSYNTTGVRMGWINGHNNWNSVGHGGMVVAALAIADIDPDLAAKTISRALDKLPGSLEEYDPDGAYPEGPSYWRFGTSFVVMAANTMKTALGSDFGISASPGFMQGADFRLQATAPSGECFNFADCESKPDGESSVLLAWFAAQTGDAIYLDRTFFAQPEKGERLAAAGLVWLSQFTERKHSELALTWSGKGISPVAVFRAPKNDPGNLYLAAKGGFAQISHGNMDTGTFVFELNGVRWVVDPGNQEYNLLNKINFPLGDYTQKSGRWTLLTKSNKGHSTVVVNDARYNVTGSAPLTDFKTGDQPEATFDLSAALNGEAKSWQRRFVKESNQAVVIQDQFEANDRTKEIVWQLITTAEVEPVEGGAILRQDGKELRVSIVTPHGLSVGVVSLDPPPLEIDKTIKGLKRVEIKMPASALQDGKGGIEVRLAGIH